MRVLLFDLDRRAFGNLVLMKLSAWHKARGDEVFLDQADRWDKSYVSCVFTRNTGRNTYPLDAEKGGTGFNTRTWLPEKIEHIMPDYQLYGTEKSYSMGFTSRGCIRKCPWCVVPEKEGWIKPWAEIYEFWNRKHRKVLLLDNNILASPNWRDTMKALDKERIEVDFNQGLDIRLVTDEVVWYLRRLRARNLRFAFDEWGYHQAVENGVKLLVRNGFSVSHLKFYVLLGFRQDPAEEFARLELLTELGCSIFPMVYVDGQGIAHPPAPGPIPTNMHGSRTRIRKLARLKGQIKGEKRKD